ncbi:MAG: N-6 DNA methylase [Phycisphaerae bacterium]|nr:N-6 DNA methylase [Phycisphaerae bacterium]
MPNEVFSKYLSEINKAYFRGDSTEHTHRPALKALVEVLAKKITATNEPKRTECGAPDFIISRRVRVVDQKIGYIECKDIGTDLKQAAKTEQIKKRYLPSLHNLILTDYIEFWWYVDEEKRMTAKLAEDKKDGFRLTERGQKEVMELFECFFAQEPEKVTTAKYLATKMAHKAQMMRDVIVRTFDQEQETGPLHGQFEGFKDVLLHDLTEQEFADMYAQTISYGLFTARCHIDEKTLFGEDKQAVFHGMNGKADEFTREHAAFMLPKTNPFLRSVFGHIAGPDLDERVSWLVDDLVELLSRADMGHVLRDFARKKGRRDPVVHFYETFLAEYDPKMRKKRGVYYTPDEVVSYIVRSVDWVLKETFGVKRGLADESKVTVDGKETHKILILDPAVGTGTFLFEVIDLIHSRFKRQKGMWSGYVREHLLSRLFGFEIQMAPYAVCHMKLGLELAETGYDFQSDERLGIYLTNTLEEAEGISRNVFVQSLSEEARAANNVKKDLPIMVVCGNPPYAGLSVNMNDWIEQLLKQKLPGESGAQSYYEIDGKPLGEKKVWLQDDYVKFIRFGQWRIEQSGYGVLAFITNHGYLDNPTFRGMRQSLMQTFDEIYVLDLHGNMKKKETCPDGSLDKNVFDIQQGVAIGVFVKATDTHTPAKVYHADLYGLRSGKHGKYEWLSKNDIRPTRTDWTELSPNSPYYFFVERDESKRKEYEASLKINDVLTENNVGIVTARDRLTIHQTAGDVWDTVNDFASLPPEEARSKYSLGKDVQSWKVQLAQADLNTSALSKNKITPILYRPFDIRHTYYTGKSGGFICRPIYRVMRHMLSGENLGLVFMRQVALQDDYTHFVVTRHIVDNRAFYSNKGTMSLAPLYLYPEREDGSLFEDSVWPAGEGGRVPNFSREFAEEFARRVKLEFSSDAVGDLTRTFGPEDVFHYFYGSFHSPEYRKRYAELLKIDFPRISWPQDIKMFVEVCDVGRQLVALHLVEAGILDDESKWPAFEEEGENVVEKGYPKYVAKADAPGKERLFINKDQYFEGVKPEVWKSHIGGYQVCEKWLKDRRGRELSYDDIRHYQKVVVAIGETIRLMNEPCLSAMFE